MKVNQTMRAASNSAPAGTTGLIVEPWSIGETYGVAARWPEASAPVYAYGDDGWTQTGRQVADYRHDPAAALADCLADAMRASGDDDGEAAELAGEAMEF
jgi:hypothetical protein